MKFAVTPLVLTPFVPFRVPLVIELGAARGELRLRRRGIGRRGGPEVSHVQARYHMLHAVLKLCFPPTPKSFMTCFLVGGYARRQVLRAPGPRVTSMLTRTSPSSPRPARPAGRTAARPWTSAAPRNINML